MTSIKDQARTLDSDVLFVLDSDTILESDNYIERTVQDLYQDVGVASACGRVLPFREKHRLEGLCLFLQRFTVRRPMTICGTTSGMTGCAVAYRRAHLEALFDATGRYRSIEVTDVRARSARSLKGFTIRS